VIKKFIFTGKVRRTVIDTITMAVFGYDEEEAAEKAQKVLENYPDPAKVEDVNYCYTENRAPVSIELLELEGKGGTKL
jgi:hypothetical protein